MITQSNMITELIERIPEFSEDYKKHLEENYGEVLMHPLLGEFTRFAIRVYGSMEEATQDYKDARDLFARIVDFVEDASASEDEKVVELAQLSFMENLHQAGSHYEGIRSRLGPASQRLLLAVEQ